MLNWLRRFNIFCLLESHGYAGSRFDWLAGVGVRRQLGEAGLRDGTLDRWRAGEPWVFGHLAFELQHAAFGVSAPPSDPVGFASCSFFVPELVLHASGDQLTIEAEAPDQAWQEICATADTLGASAPCPVEASLNREEYLQRVRALLGHIHRGDCYEINFCQEFHGRATGFDAFGAYARLTELSPTPFGGFYRQQDAFLACASPERFLSKNGSLLSAQPIKGTARRNLSDTKADAALRDGLKLSEKERAENVMVVDLMRNDLSRVCHNVVVPELFGLYTFPQVHQMISTVTGTLNAGVGFSDIVDATFPMGSMTGAPKKRVLELIRQYEPTPRGLFSGSLGYFHEGDFDLNVVIRSLLWNAGSGYLSYQVGSGITAYCDPEAEWEECRLKAAALEKTLGNIE